MARIGDPVVSSPDLEADSALDARFTGSDGARPRLEVSGVPAGAVELAVIVHDPDASSADGFTHWAVYGLPPEDGAVDTQAPGVRFGPNSTGAAEYLAADPPAGSGVHHYHFWVYALDVQVEGAPSREEFLRRYGDNIVGQGRLVGTFENG
jgi:Raf kinase inhibitor-like YbhB/YbcL family protein